MLFRSNHMHKLIILFASVSEFKLMRPDVEFLADADLDYKCPDYVIGRFIGCHFIKFIQSCNSFKLINMMAIILQRFIKFI